MAQHRTKQSEWPRVKREPNGTFLTADGVLRSERSLTADFGRDHVSPRHFDPMGTSDERAPPFPASERIPTDPDIKRR